MTWQDYADKHTNTPVVLVEIAFNSGTRYYSADYVRTSAQIYKGNILSLPEIYSSLGSLERKFERNVVNILFSDVDYEFRGLEESESPGLNKRTVTIKVAFEDDDYATPETVFTGEIFDWRRLDGLQFEIFIRSSSENEAALYPDKLITTTDYPSADSAVIGLPIPIPYGSPSNLGLTNDGCVPCYMVDTTQDAEVSIVGLGTAAITVNRVYINGTLKTLTTHYTVSTSVVDGKTHTLINWVAAVRPIASDEVTADLTFGTRRPVEAVRHIHENHFTETGSYNATSYTDATGKEAARGYAFDGVMLEQKTRREWEDQWRAEFEVDIYRNKANEICFNYLSGILPATINSYNEKTDILEGFDSDPQVQEIINYIDYFWDFDYYRANYKTSAVYEDTTSQTKHGGIYKPREGGMYFQFIRSSLTALDIVSRKLIRFKNPIVIDKMTFPLKCFSDGLTDVVKITHFLGGGASGYSDVKFQIREQTFDLDRFVVVLTLEDVTGFMGRGCKLGDPAVIPELWTSATTAEQEYCYMCDTDNEFSNNDPGKQLID